MPLQRLLLTVLFWLIPMSAFAGKANVLNMGNGDEPRDLDPHAVTGTPEYHIVMNLFEPLVEKDPKNLKPIPGVAESWTISPDGKTYTFKLRKNAKWSNGDPVTAEDFIYSLTRLLEPKTASEYAYQGHYVVGGKEYNKGTLTDVSKLGVKAVDPHTLEYRLVNPVPFFLTLLAHHSFFPIHRKTVEKFGARWTRPENMVGNGAFILTKWEVNKVISMKPNPKYWDRKSVKLEEANILPIQKEETEERMYRAGQVDVTLSVPSQKIASWKKEAKHSLHQVAHSATYAYFVNVTKPPLNNKWIRKALAHGFDRHQITEFVSLGGEHPAYAFTVPGMGGFQPKKYLPTDKSDLAKAKEYLARAGYPNGKGLPPIEILYNTGDNHKKIAEAMQQMWKTSLGVDLRLNNQEWKVLLNSQREKNYQLTRLSWNADYNDPNTFLDLFVSTSPNNISGFANTEYDGLIEAAGREKDLVKRLEVFQKAEALLMDELPVIPIYVYNHNYLQSPRVHGWYENVEDTHHLKYVSVDAN